MSDLERALEVIKNNKLCSGSEVFLKELMQEAFIAYHSTPKPSKRYVAMEVDQLLFWGEIKVKTKKNNYSVPVEVGCFHPLPEGWRPE